MTEKEIANFHVGVLMYLINQYGTENEYAIDRNKFFDFLSESQKTCKEMNLLIINHGDEIILKMEKE